MVTFLLSSLAFAADPTPPATPPTTTTPTTTTPSKTTPTTPATGTTPAAPAATAVPLFADLDLNKDLSLDKTEIAKIQNLTRDYATIDTDKNGKLSQEEFKAWSDKQPKPGATPTTPAAPVPTKG
jgi:hypothetical protein